MKDLWSLHMFTFVFALVWEVEGEVEAVEALHLEELHSSPAKHYHINKQFGTHKQKIAFLI